MKIVLTIIIVLLGIFGALLIFSSLVMFIWDAFLELIKYSIKKINDDS